MNQSRIELKVGIFVVAGMALLALLVLSFSRGQTLFESTYHLRILLPTAAGLKPTADVMMSGVPVGKATDLELMPDGRSVAVNVVILAKYKIRTNALIQIDALGFLGDQYLSVTPSTNLEAGYWRNGDVVQGETPFNMQEAVRSVAGLLAQGKKTMSALARGMAQGADDLIHSNTPAVNAAVTNLRSFSEKLNLIATDLDHLVATNRPAINESIQNLRDTLVSFKQVAADLEAGKGLAGGLLKDEAMKAEAASLINNANALAAAFATFGNNLNQRGIWRMLWKPKYIEENEKTQAAAH